MVLMSDAPLGRIDRIAALPRFVSAEDILADALPLLDPPSRITVTDAAERYLRVPVAGVWQAFDRTVAPYCVEPADMTQSRQFQAVVFVGPKQCGKSQMLMTVAMHAVSCEPDPVRIIHMTSRDANAWVEEKLDPTITNSPEILERLGKGRDDSTFSRKRFKGMRLTIGYPVAAQLSSTTQRKVLLTDYDHMPQRLGPADHPEGSPFGMALDRITTYMSRGCVLAESTPAFPVTDLSWRPDPAAPHAFPPVAGGIVQIYNEGTRGRWYWACPECDGLFEPSFGRLRYDAAAAPAAAGDGAEMECPHCGALIAHRHKVGLNRAALLGRGGWLHEGTDGSLVRIGDSALRATNVASYALNGAAAAFASWSGIVTSYETARRRMEEQGDETDFARAHYTEIGVPWTPRSDSDTDLPLSMLREGLKDDLIRGHAPEWTRFVTISVDVQNTWFAVMATAWGEGGQRTIIDRFNFASAPPDAPRAADRGIEPPRYIEDWAVLLPLADRYYPVEGRGYALQPLALAIDFHGAPGVSDNAEIFWRERKKAGQGSRWFLTRGHGGLHQRDRVWYEAPERAAKGKRARGIKLLNMSSDRLKDSVVAALGRGSEGAGAYLLPLWLPEDALTEFTAERRTNKGWEKRPGMVRNEIMDQSVQALALAEHKGMLRVDWAQPPDFFALGPENLHAVQLADGSAAAPAPRSAKADSGPIRIKWLDRRR